MKFVTIVTSAAIVLFSSVLNLAHATPPVYWEPTEVNAIVTRGGQTEVMATLKAVGALGNVYLRITPEIKPYVDVSPSTLNNVKAGDTIPIRITIHAAAASPLRLFDGTIQVRLQTDKSAKGKVLARPLPVQLLIRGQEELAGADTDGNGIWDYVDQYINSQYPNDDRLRAGLGQFANAMQGGLLHAADKNLSLGYAADGDRAIECVYFLHPNDADTILSDLQAHILNNKTRSRAYIMFSEQSAGQVFKSAPYSQRGASCISQ